MGSSITRLPSTAYLIQVTYPLREPAIVIAVMAASAMATRSYIDHATFRLALFPPHRIPPIPLPLHCFQRNSLLAQRQRPRLPTQLHPPTPLIHMPLPLAHCRPRYSHHVCQHQSVCLHQMSRVAPAAYPLLGPIVLNPPLRARLITFTAITMAVSGNSPQSLWLACMSTSTTSAK
jgi:hypothetical protein